MTKAKASAFLSLMEEFVRDLDVQTLQEGLGHTQPLTELHDYLTKHMKAHVEKFKEVLIPKAGKRLTPEKVGKQAEVLFHQALVTLKFSSTVIFNQAFQICKLEMQKEELTAQVALLTSANGKKTKREGTKK